MCNLMWGDACRPGVWGGGKVREREESPRKALTASLAPTRSVAEAAFVFQVRRVVARLLRRSPKDFSVSCRSHRVGLTRSIHEVSKLWWKDRSTPVALEFALKDAGGESPV